MEELKRVNAKIARKQIFRIIGGLGSFTLGVILIAKYNYQKGITDDQISISKEFPDEYAIMTKKSYRRV